MQLVMSIRFISNTRTAFRRALFAQVTNRIVKIPLSQRLTF